MEVGTIGGGTGLPTQHTCLRILNCLPNSSTTSPTSSSSTSSELNHNLLSQAHNKEDSLEQTPFESSNDTSGQAADRLASIVGSAVLCGELSLLCSLSGFFFIVLYNSLFMNCLVIPCLIIISGNSDESTRSIK